MQNIKRLLVGILSVTTMTTSVIASDYIKYDVVENCNTSKITS